jgi:L-cysteine desulfidase
MHGTDRKRIVDGNHEYIGSVINSSRLVSPLFGAICDGSKVHCLLPWGFSSWTDQVCCLIRKPDK